MLPTHHQPRSPTPSAMSKARYLLGRHIPPKPVSPPGTLWSQRATEVRDAFLHAYDGYKKHAAGHDELLPVSGGKVNNFNGWSVSIVDGLDTMWIMGLQDEFYDAIPMLANLSFTTQNTFVPFFETVIRYLGGLLSGYALSGEPILLARADDLGKALLPALNTPSGLPMFAVNTATGETRAGWSQSVLWAEAMSCQMEFKYLAHLTGRAEYYEKVEHIMDIMDRTKPSNDLFPTMWNMQNGRPNNNQQSVGAFADSAYEYLLKQYLLTAQSEPKAREMYIKAASGIIDNLLFLSPNRKLLYVTDIQNGRPSHVLEHLSCFLPGLLALGAHTLDLPAAESERHRWAASGLAYTCWISYADQATGLGPDEMMMDSGGAMKWMDALNVWDGEGRPGDVPPGLHEPPPVKSGSRDYRARKTSYLLRPETVESFYVLWRTTGDEIWRERGWEVFQSIEKHTRTKYGYASLSNVDDASAPKKDEMPSYFLAETLKYLYLLFTDEELVPLRNWVFNTEAHPLPIFQWTKWEQAKYGIAKNT
ncbi:glycoside hydrolase family 47 protein [Hygrophoropsis aurantiaca]|uniref:Glycoside hydrolase family 47 protein n=1 Tax=Hygrophoropsis aurantiaca TaxID=72124 RepID=A0ACB8AN35_9AGAM|nr:glycoside hydrolase family 47 protein [Hygrophoropsis aurantiaca]